MELNPSNSNSLEQLPLKGLIANHSAIHKSISFNANAIGSKAKVVHCHISYHYFTRKQHTHNL